MGDEDQNRVDCGLRRDKARVDCRHEGEDEGRSHAPVIITSNLYSDSDIFVCWIEG